MQEDGFRGRLLDELWADVESSKTYPEVRPLLAHYTRLDVVESILKCRQLWLSHPYKMNDHQELAWAMTEGRRRAASSVSLSGAMGKVSFSAFMHRLNVLSEFDEVAANLETYIACFCEYDKDEPDGILSMWRSYSGNGNGAALIFDTGKLADPVEPHHPLVLAPVVYLSDEQRRSWIDRTLDVCAKYGGGLNHHEVQDVALMFYERLRLFSLFTKNSGFREEREWRLVYDPKRDVKGYFKSCFSYSVGDRGIEPKFKIRFDRAYTQAPLDILSVIDRVVLGPTSSDALSVLATKTMLAECGLPGLSGRVFASGTPLRP